MTCATESSSAARCVDLGSDDRYIKPSHSAGLGEPQAFFSSARAQAACLSARSLVTGVFLLVSLHCLEAAMQRSLASLAQLLA